MIVLEQVQGFEMPGLEEVAENVFPLYCRAWQPGEIIEDKANCRTMENAELPE